MADAKNSCCSRCISKTSKGCASLSHFVLPFVFVVAVCGVLQATVTFVPAGVFRTALGLVFLLVTFWFAASFVRGALRSARMGAVSRAGAGSSASDAKTPRADLSEAEKQEQARKEEQLKKQREAEEARAQQVAESLLRDEEEELAKRNAPGKRDKGRR
jgi:hypothetical protein